MPREHSIALSAGYGEYDCECGPCSINKINAKRQSVEQNDEFGSVLAVFGMLFAGIFLFGLGYLCLMIFSWFDIKTGAVFNWDWLWWDFVDWREF